MDKPSVSARFRYWFDSVMARGAGALIGLLALATVVFIVLVAIVVQVFGIFPEVDGSSSALPFVEVLWGNLMRAMDAGTVAGDVGWGFRLIMLVVTLFGILTVASLIGIVSGAFDERVAELRKGRSTVLEKEHTLILGWSSKVMPIVAEICEANRSLRRASIVILAPHDKVEMEEQLADAVPDRGRTRIVVRTGDPMNLGDLEIGSPHAARSIIILPPDDAANPDAIVIKTVLAITNNPRRKDGKYHIVAEIEKPRYLDAARLVGKDEAQFVLSRDFTSKIMVQTSRQSGLSIVYQELLDFAGNEIYLTEQPTLVGMTYAEVQRAFATSAVMGIARGEDVLLNPPGDTVYAAGDSVIVIAEDDSTIALSQPGDADLSVISTHEVPPLGPEHTLVLGYHRGLKIMLDELSGYVTRGSKVTIVADRNVPDALLKYGTLTVDVQRADVTDIDELEALPLEEYDHIMVLADRDETDIQESDAKTLITLLSLRELEERRGLELKVVSEMLDDRNRELAEVTNADDFIVSDKLVSLAMSQISENSRLSAVFGTLFSSDGSEIYLRPADLYVTPGSTVDFYTVLAAAASRGETALGYRIAAQSRDAASAYGVTVNPDKTQALTFQPGDKLIVLAEG